jgi:hypothetical protein
VLRKNATYVLDVVDETVTGGLRADEGSTPSEALSSEHTGELILEPSIGTEKESNLASASSDVAG